MSGQAHVELHVHVVERLRREHSQDVQLLQVSNPSDGIVVVLLASNKLPAGYHGVQNLFFNERGEVAFRKDQDT
jgi:hypothetical protein